MRAYTAIIEKCPDAGYVPNFPGAPTQGESLDELCRNLREVIEMLLEDGE
ncbi:MAG: type II toxin-antitoxin system HicB family antitoxin [Caldilineaceae bacterium]|nr:type II toxin-antitoxin system HicB family antitoxin [Caldilineaceae bacterium]